PFRAFGFPAGFDDGVWASGRILAPQAAGWLQVEDTKATGYFVQPGFSGGPVWDEQVGGIVGMSVAADTRQSVRAAFVLPVAALVDAWPPLGEWVREIPIKEDNTDTQDDEGKASSNHETVSATERDAPDSALDKQEKLRRAWLGILLLCSLIISGIAANQLGWLNSNTPQPLTETVPGAPITTVTPTLYPFPSTPTNTPTLTTSTPTSEPTPYCHCTETTVEETLICLIQAEREAAEGKDLSTIEAIFDKNAVMRNRQEDENRNEYNQEYSGRVEIIEYYAGFFHNASSIEVERTNITKIEIDPEHNTAWFTSGNITIVDGDAWTNEAPSDHWIFGKTTQGCWVITKFEFNASHIPFP
ncbi:MAG: trypsin-like peptidase domain-containing protein, partial [Chloroflexi bacterium]|nr:trypsin-like peptidase domain-containing protein [Chloroflexota bacterium]